MSLIHIQNLTFCYDGSYDNIFENVSFQIDTDWKLGLTGRNGRGKTTFFKLLMGQYAYEGSISKSVSFDYFPFPVTDKERDVWQILEEVSPQAEQWELIRELSLLDLSADILYRPFSTLSQGEQSKALLAALFCKENHFLLIDEPTNHLDLVARQIVSQYLQTKKGFILISHDRTFLDACVDHILSINKMGIDVQKGNFSSWWQNKKNQDDFEAAENEKLKKSIKRLEESSRRTAKWSDQVESTKNGVRVGGLKADKGHVGHMAAKMMKRSKSIESRRQTAIDEKAKLLKNVDTADSLKINSLRHHSSRLIHLEDVALFYGEKQILEHINLSISQGDRVALQGRNGSGKSSLLKLILQDQTVSFSGQVERAPHLIISYVSQDTSFLHGSLKDYARQLQIDETIFMTNLAKLDFSRTQFEKDMESYSEGQKKKVLLAASLCQKAHIHIWDEPLNFIDILSRMQIAELITSANPTMLLVEHDISFTESVATKTLQL